MTYAVTDLAAVTTEITNMLSTYLVPLIGILAVIFVAKQVPSWIKRFAR